MNKGVVLFGALGAMILGSACIQIGNVKLLAGVAATEPDLPGRLVSSRQVVQRSLEQWTGEDAPYQIMRKDIDDKVSKGVEPGQLRREAWIQAEQHSHDPKLQFLWAYCAWKTIAHDAPAVGAPTSPFMMKLQTTHLMVYQLSHASSPKSYNYSRLLYLGLPDDEYNLTGFGERLLRQDVNDNEVKYHLIGDYTSQVSLIGFHTKRVEPILQNRALELAHQLVSSSPKNASYWATLGSVYLSAAGIRYNPNDAKKGITAYEKYLQLAPDNDEFRPQAKIIMAFIYLTHQNIPNPSFAPVEPCSRIQSLPPG